MGLFGSGVAAADDFAGQTYADASEAADEEGLSVVVGVRFGDKLEEDDCIVSSSKTVTALRQVPFQEDFPQEYSFAEDEIQFNLNCNGGYATANTPGDSLGSQTGRDALEAAQEAEEEGSEEAADSEEEEE